MAERYRRTGWEGLIEAFVDEEGAVPPWMLARIRATDIEPVVGWTEARLDWGWNAWDALARVRTPTLFLIGELEDPDDLMDKAAREMPDGRRVRIPGKDHINGFLDADAALPAARAFLDELRA